MPKKAHIIFTHGGGRLANQMMIYAHLYSFYLEHQDRLGFSQLPLNRYSHLFQNIPDHCTHPAPTPVTDFVLRLHKRARDENVWQEKSNLNKLHARAKIFGIQSLQGPGSGNDLKSKAFDHLNLSDPAVLTQLISKRYTFLSGWEIRSWELVKKYETAVREALSPAPQFAKAADNLMEKMRQNYDFIIGIHMRQTDYRYHVDGKLFFTSEQYKKWALEAIEVFQVKGKVAVIIASDEKQDRSLFEHPDIYFGTGAPNGTGHYMEDFVTLSRCDLIIGPPTTFNDWAGFIGKTPSLTLMSGDQTLEQSTIHPSLFPRYGLVGVEYEA